MHSKRPKFSKFSGEVCPRTPLEARALRRSLKTPLASFSISPPTSQILPSTPFLIENPENLANTVYESIKRVVQWAAYYYTHEKSYYPVVGQATPLNALPRMSHLKPARKLNDGERESMLEWVANNGKAVRQRTVRQETTMFKAGTLPLNMYATSEQPKEKITMERTLGHVDAAGDLGCPVQVVESNRKRQEENQKDTDNEQESEYDKESESELPATVDSDLEDEMTFLRAVTTRSGRTIRVTSKFF